jgi:hypothetical protein
MSLPEAPEAFLFQRLTSQTAVSSLVGARVFPMVAPHATPLPLVVYQRTGVDRPQSLAGNVGNPVVTLRLTTYGTSYTAVKQIARAVRIAIDGWTGTTASVTIQRTTLVTEADGVDLPADDQMLPYYSVQQSFEFRIDETVPTTWLPAPTLPGAPTITLANAAAPVVWTTPSNGDAPLTKYRLYVVSAGNILLEDATWKTSSSNSFAEGEVIQVSAVNAVGEGPKSASVTVGPQ